MEEIKLICFDLDLTLITHTSWEALNAALGISREDDRKLFEQYAKGFITEQEWNDKILEHYQTHVASTREGMTAILKKYSYSEGAKEAVAYLKSKGYIIALISGSMDVLVDIVAKDLGIDHAKANNALVFDGEGRLVSIKAHGADVSMKQRYLEDICRELGISIGECACVGDGANDIKMFQETGHGITFKGSPIESEAWKVIGTLNDLRSIF